MEKDGRFEWLGLRYPGPSFKRSAREYDEHNRNREAVTDDTRQLSFQQTFKAAEYSIPITHGLR
jgi:hypothetical protein